MALLIQSIRAGVPSNLVNKADLLPPSSFCHERKTAFISYFGITRHLLCTGRDIAPQLHICSYILLYNIISRCIVYGTEESCTKAKHS